MNKCCAMGIAFVVILAGLGSAVPAMGEDPGQPLDRQLQARRRPATYLAIFLNGYADDRLPQDPAEFEKLLGYTAEPEMVHRDNMVLTR